MHFPVRRRSGGAQGVPRRVAGYMSDYSRPCLGDVSRTEEDAQRRDGLGESPFRGRAVISWERVAQFSVPVA